MSSVSKTQIDEMAGGIDVSPEGNGGVLKEVKRPGLEGEANKPWKGDRVSVHYVGTLEDGTKFDSSRDRGQHFQFTLGKKEVIAGWDLGVATMSKGELAVLTIQSEFGYGDSGSPPKIPGGATLVFEVELVDFEGEDVTKGKDGGIVKRTRKAGEGLDHPNDDSLVEVSVRGECAGKVVEERKLSFSLGEGQEQGLPRGVEMAIEKMKKLEEARVKIGPAYAFGAEGDASKGVPAGATVEYDITLHSFERAKESWQLDGEQKLEQAGVFKEKGTNFFKQGKYALASKKYKKIIEFLEHEISLKGESEETRRSILQAGRLNLAMCHLKEGEWIEARNVCDKVIEENPASAKAYFRRGESLMHLNDHSVAKADFMKVAELEPDNKAAKNKVLVCNAEIKKQKQQEKKTFANMFDKFAKIDAKREEEARKNQPPLEINEWENKNKKGGGDGDVLKVSGDVQMDLDLNKEIDAAEEEMKD